MNRDSGRPRRDRSRAGKRAPRRGEPKTPPAKTHGWRVLFYLIVVGLAIGIALAARHSSGGQR